MLGEEVSVLNEEGPLIWALDDEEMTLSLLGDMLEQGGYRFEGFEDEQGLFERLNDGGERPELLLLDWMLRRSSGHEVLKAWWISYAEIPVIVVTALAGESVLLNAFEAGACDVVRKPFDVTELLARIGYQLTSRAQHVNEHLMVRREQTLVSLAKQLARSSSEEACWQALHEALATELGGEVFTLRGEDLCSPDRTRLDLASLPAIWSRVVRGSRSWLEPRKAHAVHRSGLVEEVRRERHEIDAPGAWVEPLLHEQRVAGVLWWRGAARLSPGVESFIRDVRELHELALDRLRHAPSPLSLGEAFSQEGPSRIFFERIIEASEDAVVAADRSGEIVLFNSAAERILRWDRGDALGKSVELLYNEGVARQIMKRLRSTDETGGQGRLSRSREVLLTRDRAEIPVELSAALLQDDRGREIGTVGLFRDLRERIDIEGRLEQATQDLEAQREQAIMAQMAGATAHELNQPLTSMLNYLDVLKEVSFASSEQGRRARRAVEVIDRDLLRMAEIVKKVAQITRYRTRPYVDDLHIVDLQIDEERSS